MIKQIARGLWRMYDGRIAEQAQKMLDKHLEKVDKEERPYRQTRIGFGVSFRKD